MLSSKFDADGRRAYKTLEKYFLDMVIDEQGYLGVDENFKKLMRTLGSICAHFKDNEKKSKVEQEQTKVLSVSKNLLKGVATLKELQEESCARWERITALLKGKSKFDQSINGLFMREATLGLLYPKIDSHVSAQTNHLLKCPFNVHHDTGLLSVPIEDIAKFDVNSCLTIFDVLQEGGQAKMATALAIFDKFCKPIVKSE